MATIKDVARDAGVSVATVSRVFNDSGLVSEDTRRTVLDVAAKLNYWPNGVARSLITSRTHALGVLLPDLAGEFFSEVIRGIDLAARAQGLHLLVSSSHADTRELVSALRSLRGRIDGLIVMAPDVDAPAAIRASAGDFPIVLVDPGYGVEEFDTISIANHEGAQAVVRHLLSLGHRRIATVTGPLTNIDAEQRLAGYHAAMRAGGGEFSTDLVIHGDFSEGSGRAAGHAIAALRARPTAVFAANDYMAAGVIGSLTEAGVRVPQDVAVAGFDDIPIARYLTPPLTTVHVGLLELGERAVGRLLEIQGGKNVAAPQHNVLSTTLVVRRSCGAPSGEPQTGKARS